jgi:hypothetical protein
MLDDLNFYLICEVPEDSLLTLWQQAKGSCKSFQCLTPYGFLIVTSIFMPTVFTFYLKIKGEK